jgi:SAM-dependent methyltransferase
LLDDALLIDYSHEVPVKSEERLYDGGGAGVQTSYSSILNLLNGLKFAHGERLTDLGSGYGRLGLMLGLFRADLTFSGYEYVGHRVDSSSRAAKHAGVSDRVRFFQQDLADPNFALPESDVYYLYDPFSPSTYQKILQQLITVGSERPIRIVTKGNAKSWLDDAISNTGWENPEPLDEGGLLVYKSPASL